MVEAVHKLHHVLGIGFGPAAIAVAAAIEDAREAGRVLGFDLCFLEQRAGPEWQSQLMLRGTDINHHFLRDFATPRNPRSRFTFANYLKESGRLFHFGHLGGKTSRIEWEDYVKWTARGLAEYVIYRKSVNFIEPVDEGGRISQLALVCSDDSRYYADTLLLNTGPVPYVPEQLRPWLGERFFHTCSFIDNMAALDPKKPWKICLLGSGQSAGESLLYLHDTYSESTMYSVHRKVGFKQVDLGRFSNEAYFPPETDYFYSLSCEERQRVQDDLHQTNYSSIDEDVDRALYWKMYEDRVMGKPRIHMLARRLLEDIECIGGERYSLRFVDTYTGEPSRIEVDIVIICTGYHEEVFPRSLEPLRPWIELDEKGGPHISYDYRISTTACFGPTIYLNGMCERTHGISDSASFSMMAIKADRILSSLVSNLSTPPQL